MAFALPNFTPLRTVRAKIVFWSVTVLGLSLLLFSGLLRYQVQRDILQTVDADLKHFSTWAADDWNWKTYGKGAQDSLQGGPQDGPRDHFDDFDFGPPPDGPPRRRKRRGNGPEDRPGEFMKGGPPIGTPSRPEPRVLSLDGSIADTMLGPGEPQRAPRTGALAKGPWDVTAFQAARDEGKSGFSTVYNDDEILRVYSMPLPNPRGLNKHVLQTARPISEVNWAIGRVNRTLWLCVPFCIVIAALGGAFITSRILRPVRNLTDAASSITARELSGRLPVTGEDEFAHLSETFNQMLSRLEASFDQQRRFTSDASHELRTPLAAIKAHTSLALQGERSAEELRQTLQTVDGAADRASRTVQDLLLLARSDTGRLGVSIAPTYLPDVILRAMDTVEAAVGYDTDAAMIEMRLEGPPPTIAGDAHHLTRLFTNLIENAVRHTPPTGQVQVLMQTLGDMVTVSIIDTGEGIAPEHLPHLGERFYRVDSSRARTSGGTGLGLAICRSIVEAHGGQLTFESTLGRGTTAQVTLSHLAPLTEPE